MASPTLVASLFALFLAGQAAAQCSDGWVFNKGSCYQIFNQSEPWLDANEYCQLFGGYLVEMGSQDEIDFASKTIKGINLVGNTCVWIGLNDMQQENVWKWTVSKSGLKSSLANWGRNQPNNRYLNGSQSGEDCGCVFDDTKWYDEDCDREYFFMCERSAADPVIG